MKEMEEIINWVSTLSKFELLVSHHINYIHTISQILHAYFQDIFSVSKTMIVPSTVPSTDDLSGRIGYRYQWWYNIIDQFSWIETIIFLEILKIN